MAEGLAVMSLGYLVVGMDDLARDSIDVLALFNRQLQMKGSRIAVCCLDPAARASFFDAR